MDRSIIAPRKAEEKELGEKLYQKLQGLQLIHPGTDELRKICTPDMFLKPNQTAFFQVIHYLLRLVDPAEFKKRFYWPITDKKSEANFRSSTVEYLKHISDKHQLNWNVKSYLVVMPGGMKFMTFLLELVGFVVLDLTRKREKELAPLLEGGQLASMNLKQMKRQNEFYKQYASAFMAEADKVIEKFQTNTQLLHGVFEEIESETGIPKDTLLDDDEFTRNFGEDNERVFQTKLADRCVAVDALDVALQELKTAIDGFQLKDAETKFDCDEVRQALRSVAMHFDVPALRNAAFAFPGAGETVRMNSLMLAFNSVCEFLEQSFATAEAMPRSSEFLKGELESRIKELHAIDGQISDFKKMLNSSHKKREDERQFQTPTRGAATVAVDPDEGGADLVHKTRLNALMMKFVSTPPIKWDSVEGNRSASTRLPLLDDLQGAKRTDASFNSFLAPTRSARKQKCHNTTLNTTMQRSKIIDPTQLLRTIHKGSATLKVENLSGLSSKWKEHKSLFASDADATASQPPDTPKRSPLSVMQNNANRSDNLSASRSITATPTGSRSTLSPFNTNEKTRIARSAYNVYAGVNPLDTSLGLGKKLSAVKKVQDASLNFHNLSTSPSGRLEPLVTPDKYDLPKLQVNDTSITASKAPTAAEGSENNANLENIQSSFVFNVTAEDDLLDISDTILKDLIL